MFEKTTQELKLVAADGAWVLEGEAPQPSVPDAVRAKIEASLSSGKLQLPIMPEASAILVSMTSNEDCGIQDLIDVVQRDPSLAAHLLRIANSALYAPKYPANSLRHAITRLGTAELRRVAISIACQTRVFRVRGWENEVAQLFAHSLTTALYATTIAKRVRANEEEAFLCGLLHDVGHAIVLQTLADLKPTLGFDLSREMVMSLAETYHAEVGSRLVEQWGLSPRFAQVIFSHHEVKNAPAANVALVHLADRLAYGAPDVLETLSPRMLAPLHLAPEGVAELFAERKQIVALAAAIM